MTHELPRSADGFTELHQHVAMEFEHRLGLLCGAMAVTFGEDRTRDALRVLVLGGAPSPGADASFDDLSWREVLEDGSLDAVELTQPWRDGAEYAAQGVAAREPFNQQTTLEERRSRIDAVIEYGRVMIENGSVLFGDRFMYIWNAVAARAALDFGGTVTAEGLQLLSGVLPAAIRNAVSQGELHPDARGAFLANDARSWLERRRGYCPSRWTDLNDGQEILDPERVITPDELGMIFVPQDADGTPFTPEHVVRGAKSGGGLSITVGLKGSEKQFRDFYKALEALLKMDVPRWRRRNEAGNWGTVRARGAWVKVSKARVDEQLAAMVAEAR